MTWIGWRPPTGRLPRCSPARCRSGAFSAPPAAASLPPPSPVRRKVPITLRAKPAPPRQVWESQMLLVASMALALRQLAAEQARGRSVREVLRATLAMEVNVGAGIQNAQTIAALLAAIEIKDEDTTRHNLRVAELAVAIGRGMRLAGPILRVPARSGLLHDVGKVAIPDAVLGKPGPLNDEEWGLVRKHPGTGVEILGRAAKLRREAGIWHRHHEPRDRA